MFSGAVSGWRSCCRAAVNDRTDEKGCRLATFSLLKISNRYRFLLCVPSMTESCFCGFAPKQDVGLYHFTENYGRDKLRHRHSRCQAVPHSRRREKQFFSWFRRSRKRRKTTNEKTKSRRSVHFFHEENSSWKEAPVVAAEHGDAALAAAGHGASCPRCL